MELNNFIFYPLLLAAIYVYFPEEFDTNLKPRNVPQSELKKEYDFIIIGAGTAGCVVARRLSENPSWNVLLIEAGGDETPLSDLPYIWNWGFNKDLDWNYTTVRQNRTCLSTGGICPYHYGHVMGGSAVLGAMLYVRGNRRDYDGWAELGNEGWSYEDVLPYFIKSENATEPNLASSPYHGTKGPLQVQYARYYSPLADDYIRAGVEFGWIQRDYNVRQDNSIDKLQLNIDGSTRDSSSRAYLNPIRNRKNLAIIKRSFATKIYFDSSQKFATGVEYIRNGKTYVIKVIKEVIVSCGAVNTPKLLMLSGIGPRGALNKLGINVISDLPVGRNLQDHLGPFLNFEMNKDVTITPNIWRTNEAIIEYSRDRTGPLTSAGGFEAIAFYNTYNSSKPPNIGIQFISSQWPTETGNKPILTVAVYGANPKSRGSVTLKSSNPFDSPLIDPNYYSVESDFAIMSKSVDIIFNYMKTPNMRKYSPRFYLESYPKCQNLKGKRLRDCLVAYYEWIMWHPSCTARMGPKNDSESVVNPKLIVKGLKNLRVVDASIMPFIVRGNINAAVVMIGEKASDIIKSDNGF